MKMEPYNKSLVPFYKNKVGPELGCPPNTALRIWSTGGEGGPPKSAIPPSPFILHRGKEVYASAASKVTIRKWNFQHLTNNCDYTTHEKPRTGVVWSIAKNMTRGRVTQKYLQCFNKPNSEIQPFHCHPKYTIKLTKFDNLSWFSKVRSFLL